MNKLSLNDVSSEDVIVGGIGTDDVSSIYPLDTMNEVYYNYSPKTGAKP